MNVELIVFFDLVIAVVILTAGLTILGISYAKTLQKFQGLQKEEDQIKSEAQRKASLILEETRHKALSIIASANLFENQSRNIFEQELKNFSISQTKTFEKVSYDFLKAYEKELEDLKEDIIKIIKNISNDIQNATLAELKDFKEILKSETFASQKIVEGKIEEDYKTVQKEIQYYKTERIKKIEDQIYEIVGMVSKLVIGKALTLEEHEQLVIDALNRAKQEEVL